MLCETRGRILTFAAHMCVWRWMLCSSPLSPVPAHTQRVYGWHDGAFPPSIASASSDRSAQAHHTRTRVGRSSQASISELRSTRHSARTPRTRSADRCRGWSGRPAAMDSDRGYCRFHVEPPPLAHAPSTARAHHGGGRVRRHAPVATVLQPPSGVEGEGARPVSGDTATHHTPPASRLRGRCEGSQR